MNVTRLAGWLLLIIAVIYLGISIVNFGPKYGAAGEIGEKHESYGLQTSGTTLRFNMGFEFFLNVLGVGVIALAGWWLTTSEVRQLAWIILVGVFALFSIIVRSTPVLPMKVAKRSAGAAFYGAQVNVVLGSDVTNNYVVISRNQSVRTAEALSNDGAAGIGRVVLDLGDSSAASQYRGCTAFPLTVTGNVMGTAGIAQGKELETVPLIKVKGAHDGLPK